MRHDDIPLDHPPPNGRHARSAADALDAWLDALVPGAAGPGGRTPSAGTNNATPIPPGRRTWSRSDASRIPLADSARRVHALAADVDHRAATDATMEGVWEKVMTDTLGLDRRSGTVAAAPLVRNANVSRHPRRLISSPQPARMRQAPKLAGLVMRWQPAVSTVFTLVLLTALIAGYAASRGVLPPGSGSDSLSYLAAPATVSPHGSPVAAECTVEPLSVEEIQRIEQLPPEFPPRAYPPVRQADAETAAAVLAVYREQQACYADSAFSAFALGTDRYVWEVSSTYWREGAGTPAVGSNAGYNSVSSAIDNEVQLRRSTTAIDRIIDDFIFHNGQVRPEITAAAWWSAPQDEDVFEQSFPPESVFVLSDGRVAALWGDLTIPHEYGQSMVRLPKGFYQFVAFAQEDGQWLVDEQVGFAFTQ